MTVESDFGERRVEMMLPSNLGQTCHDMFMFRNIKSQNCTSFIFIQQFWIKSMYFTLFFKAYIQRLFRAEHNLCWLKVKENKTNIFIM